MNVVIVLRRHIFRWARSLANDVLKPLGKCPRLLQLDRLEAHERSFREISAGIEHDHSIRHISLVFHNTTLCFSMRESLL